MPSSHLLARLESEAAGLTKRAADETASAEMIEARVAQLQYAQDQESAQLAAELAAVEKLRAEIAERQQDIDDGKKRAEQHKQSAQAMQDDADYLTGHVRMAPALQAPETAGPQPAAPATPAEMAAQLATSGATPRCLNCGNEINKDSAGWHHQETRTIYCSAFSDVSTIRVAAELQDAQVIA